MRKKQAGKFRTFHSAIKLYVKKKYAGRFGTSHDVNKVVGK